MIKQYLIAFFAFAALSPLAYSQQAEHPGITLYKEGRHGEAAGRLAAALRDSAFKADPLMWNYLGLSRLAMNEPKQARKAFEEAARRDPARAEFRINLAYTWMMSRNMDRARKEASRAIALDPKNAIAHYIRGSASLGEGKLDDAERDAVRALEIDPAYEQAYILRSDILVARLSAKLHDSDRPEGLRENIGLLKEAGDVLRSGSERIPAGDKKLIDSELAGIEAFYAYLSKVRPPAGTTPAEPEPGVTPLNVTAKPRARYTDRARQANVQGTIRLAVMFGASGLIEHVLLLRKLGYGLDQEALAAARQIKFEPEKRDGKPVSAVRVLEYTFSIY